MKKILSYIPFLASIAITITMIFAFSLTGSLGNLALMIPCIVACGMTHELIEE